MTKQHTIALIAVFLAVTSTAERTLHEAAEHGSVAEVEALITAGADVNARDGWGKTPLHHTFDVTCRPQVVEILLRAGADVNAAVPTGQTALHYASLHGCTSTAEILLRAGADKTLQMGDGRTASQYTDRPGCPTSKFIDAWIVPAAATAVPTEEATAPPLPPPPPGPFKEEDAALIAQLAHVFFGGPEVDFDHPPNMRDAVRALLMPQGTPAPVPCSVLRDVFAVVAKSIGHTISDGDIVYSGHVDTFRVFVDALLMLGCETGAASS